MLLEINIHQEVVDLALGYLEYDHANPEIGMGMFTETAVNHAINKLTMKFGAKIQSEIDRDKICHEVRNIWDK